MTTQSETSASENGPGTWRPGVAGSDGFYRVGIGAELWRLLVRAKRNLHTWYLVRQTIQALSDLSDEYLHDIGITRSQIPTLARLSVEHPGTDIRILIRRYDP